MDNWDLLRASNLFPSEPQQNSYVTVVTTEKY